MVFRLFNQFSNLSVRDHGRRKSNRNINARRAILERLERREVLANYIVLNTADAGPGSLRAAIALANADTDTDTIEFNLAAGPQTIQLQSTLEISNSVDIVGPGSANLSIDGGNTVRLFQVTEPASTEVWVGFSGLTLQNGNAGLTGDGGLTP